MFNDTVPELKSLSFNNPTCPAAPARPLIDNLSAVSFKSAIASEDIVPSIRRGCPITEKPVFFITILLSFKSTSALILSTLTLYKPYLSEDTGTLKCPVEFIVLKSELILKSASIPPVALIVFKSFIPKDLATESANLTILLNFAFERNVKFIKRFLSDLILPIN